MKVLVLAVSTLVLIMATSIEAVSWDQDYSPCKYDCDMDGNYTIDCEGRLIASEVLAAFRRNQNNTNIDVLIFNNMDDDMTDDIFNEILEIVASAASHRVSTINIKQIPKLTKFPEAIRQFLNLNNVGLIMLHGIKRISHGSINFPIKSPTEFYFIYSENLSVIEPGAFQGFFNGSVMSLSLTNLNTFDEVVFKPLLSGSIVEIEFRYNPIECTSCSLAWIIRDNRQFLPRLSADCRDFDGEYIDFENVDPELLRDC